MRRFFLLFVLSGFCGLVYQVVWLRLAMASFGVTTPLVSIVLSVFMAGLAIGSVGGGKLASRLSTASPASFLRIYAAAELWIGVSGVAVPPLLAWGRNVVASAGESASWASGTYYLASGAWVTLALLPFCIGMGATFPLAMAAIRGAHPDASPRSFSFLYVANVLGATAGSLISAFALIELLGFRGTLLVAAGLNAVVAIAAFSIASRLAPRAAPAAQAPASPMGRAGGAPLRSALAILAVTGLASLAMEVVWTRQFVPFQGPLVYAFATILASYLVATIAGSRLYRHRAGRGLVSDGEPAAVLLVSFVTALLPLALADPRLPLESGLAWGSLRVIVGVFPFCAALGYLTPMVMDRFSGGDPARAGDAYALNTLGCIAGPLLAGFVLLPRLSERTTLVVLALPLLLLALADLALARRLRGSSRTLALALGSVAAAALLVAATKGYETLYPGAIVKRDHTATVIAVVDPHKKKQLLVNGQGITTLTPITKEMAHLPLAFLDRAPSNALVICLGMGTSFRSALTWGIPATVVELVPSVPPLLPYYHFDGGVILGNPAARIVVDDGRRFLERSRETFDAIVIDPPPPVEAAASSLLYSREFYESARRRLAPGGILQQWLPEGEIPVIASVSKALAETFLYVRVFRSVEGWGFHYLASDRPIPRLGPAQLVAKMPPAARADLVEWGPERNAADQMRKILASEAPLQVLLNLDRSALTLSDDRPFNEYFFLRRLLRPPAETEVRR